MQSLEKVYGTAVEKNKTKLDYLTSTVNLFKSLGCTDSKVFFKASTYAHKIKPSAETANGCAEMYYKNEDYTKAISYFEEAAKLSSNDKDKADYFSKLLKFIKIEQFYKIAQNMHVSRSIITPIKAIRIF